MREIEVLEKVKPHVEGAGCASIVVWAGGWGTAIVAQVAGDYDLSRKAATLTIGGFILNTALVVLDHLIDERIKDLKDKNSV